MCLTPSEPPPPAPVYPGSYYGYNVDLSLEQVQALLQLIQPTMAQEGPSAQDGFRCSWHASNAVCHEYFTNFDDLVHHLAQMHDVQGSAGRKVICRWWTDGGSCDKEYRRDAFRRHIGTHVGLSVPCPQCDKAYSRPDSMRAHMKKAH